MQEKKSKNILFISGITDDCCLTGEKEIIKELISLGHNVTCYILEDLEKRLKQTGAKLKLVKMEKIDMKNLPPLMAKKIIFTITMSKSYMEIINDGLKSQEKYDFLIVNPLYDGVELNKIFKADDVISLYTNPIGEKSPFIEITSQKRMESFVPINNKYNINIRDYLSLPFIHDAKYKLMLTSKLFQPESLLSDNSFYFIGPYSEEETPVDESFNFKKDENKKLINISLSRLFSQNIDFFKLCVQALGNSKDYQIIVNVGKNIDIKSLGDLPDNFSVFNNVPQNKILPLTDIVMIHSGIESINEVLYYNPKLPLILIKQEMSEYDYSKIIKKCGAGIVLNDKRLTPEKLNEAINNYIKEKDKFQKGVDTILESYKEAKLQRKEILEKIFG